MGAPMHNPGACVVGLKADGNIVRRRSSGVDDIAPDRVVVVVRGAPGAPDYGERVSVEMDGMLNGA